MRSHQIALLILAASAVVLALPGGSSSTKTRDATSSMKAHRVTSSADAAGATSLPNHAPHTANHPAAVDPGPKDSAHDTNQKCIHFTSENPDWHFANTGVWGTHTDSFGRGNRTICVPTDDAAGGAMYIGPHANPQGGNTKLECYFPKSGTGNCDISLVDGYSLSVTCHGGNKKIGGGLDLWKTNKACADNSLKSQGICKNDQGYAPAQSDVTPFFQSAIEDGNKYCIWVNCEQDYYFTVGADMSCHVSGTGNR